MQLVSRARRLFSMFRRNDSVGMTQSIDEILSSTWVGDGRVQALVTRIGIAHRLVWAIPQDALSLGWRVDAEGEQDIARDLDAVLGLADQVLQAWGMARQDGGSWLWVVDGDDQSTPRRPGEKVYAVHAVAKKEASIQAWETDPRSPSFGHAKTVSVTIARDGGAAVSRAVHVSRLAYVPGAPVTATTTTDKPGYDLSYLNLYAPIIEALEEGYRANGRLLNRLSMPWLRIKEGATQTASEGGDLDAEADSFTARMQLVKEGMERSALLVLLGEDEAGWSGPSANGVRDLVNIQAERLSSVEGIPLSRLLGQAPAGLSTDDASGTRTYHKTLERYQHTIISPVLLRIYSIILGVDPTRRIVWPALERPSALEEAQVSAALAARDAQLFSIGAITPDEIRGRFADGEEVSEFRFTEEDTGEPMDENQTPDLYMGNESAQAAVEQAASEPAPVDQSAPLEGVSVAETALNGAQISSLVEIVQAVANGQLPRDSAIAIIERSFQVSAQDAEGILGSAGRGFVPARTDAVDLTPTDEMASIAARALEWRAEHGRGGTEVGVARARDLANKRQLSAETVGRMASYFARHAVDRDAPGFSEGDGFPSAGRIAWDLWGGDAGRDWAERKMDELERAEG